jgi:hypothetical protein
VSNHPLSHILAKMTTASAAQVRMKLSMTSFMKFNLQLPCVDVSRCE